jgi:hypothetical protein
MIRLPVRVSLLVVRNRWPTATTPTPVVLLFTPGSSGQPKGTILTHGGIRAAAQNAADALEIRRGDNEAMLKSRTSGTDGGSAGSVSGVGVRELRRRVRRGVPSSALATMLGWSLRVGQRACAEAWRA